MEWGQVVVTGIAALSGLGGVVLGSRLSHRSAVAAWNRDQRVATYAAVLGAIDRQAGAFALIKAHLELRKFDPQAAKDPHLRAQMEEWGRWDNALDEALPAAELVASDDVQPYLSVAVRLGMRTRQRLLLMDLDYRGLVNEAEWRSVAKMTLEDTERSRRTLRKDLAADPPHKWRGARPGRRRAAALDLK